jgi:transcriptional regulator with PAS, ATPase and Fis domain
VHEVTSAITARHLRQLHLPRSHLSCVTGTEAGQSWDFEQDLISLGAHHSCDVVLKDSTVSRRHAEIIRTRDGVVLRDNASTNGTFVGPVRVKEVFLAPDTRFRVGRTELIFKSHDEVVEIQPIEEPQFEGLVGASVAMRQVFGILDRVAPTKLTVLITGETGTGKELASRATHKRSKRADGPFIVFDCSAVPENLIESELFGHKRGAFTGAVEARAGVFEMAHKGTIFLDEIGELPLELQSKLLRVLEQREVRRIGASHTRPVDVRVVAATNRRLREEVTAGRFREDLYYRLAVVEVELPSLRERISDLPLLIQHLLDRTEHNPLVRSVSSNVQQVLNAYHWPGNVRELHNVIERAIPFCDGDSITMEALPEALKMGEISTAQSTRLASETLDQSHTELPFKDAKEHLIEAFERQYLIDLLDRHRGNVSKAARTAQMDRKSITRLMKKHQITR